ncbi:MAG: hypothetical protein H0V19_05090 [Euzebyales bacterium]|nr:hypothetical protein [Euzebyales bacterium]MBA3620720.1 hypothetical protein [Euzebyales bacterium]
MACRDMRARCVDWQRQTQARCDRWRTEWTQRCDNYKTEWTQRCDRWRTTSEQRCDRWETEWTQRCDSWGPFKILCLFWVWVSTTVCRAWVWVTTTVCELWTWVSSTVCTLWVWVSTLVCDLWVFITTFVCRAWVFVLDIWCFIRCALSRLLAPNEFSQARSECIYGWTARCRIDEDPRECAVRITLRIRLVAATGVTQADLANVQALWEPAIEQAWTDRFGLLLAERDSCPCKRYTASVDVQWVTSGEHHTVNVRAGSGRANMGTWFVNSTGGTAAHEAGHMFGNVDEYVDSNCPSRIVTSDGSIMQTSQTGTVKERHYQGFAGWLTNRTCCTYDVR